MTYQARFIGGPIGGEVREVSRPERVHREAWCPPVYAQAIDNKLLPQFPHVWIAIYNLEGQDRYGFFRYRWENPEPDLTRRLQEARDEITHLRGVLANMKEVICGEYPSISR